MKKHLSVLNFLALILFSPLNYAEASDSFALSEHWIMGQQVKLRFQVAQIPKAGLPLHLKNGLSLTFGDIISLGDLYGILGKPISYGVDDVQKYDRFKKAFASFAERSTALEETNKIAQLAKMEALEIDEGMKRGETAEAIFQRIGNEIGRQLNCITGGGCNLSNWWAKPGRYLKLAIENFDHFSPNNLVAYKIGHRAALQQALIAHQTQKQADLEIAYAMDAFACHFLSDRFAAGHLRTPRIELKDKVSPAVLGSLLSNYMHNEENKYGVHVHNKLGDRWVIFGDFSYFNPFNQTSRELLSKALQQSADDVFSVYYSGVLPSKNSVLDLVPYADPIDSPDNQDIAPMFYWDSKNKLLLRRLNLSNPYDHNWTTKWWGWSTFFVLKNQHSLTSTVQISLTNYLSQFDMKIVNDRESGGRLQA